MLKNFTFLNLSEKPLSFFSKIFSHGGVFPKGLPNKNSHGGLGLKLIFGLGLPLMALPSFHYKSTKPLWWHNLPQKFRLFIVIVFQQNMAIYIAALFIY